MRPQLLVLTPGLMARRTADGRILLPMRLAAKKKDADIQPLKKEERLRPSPPHLGAAPLWLRA